MNHTVTWTPRALTQLASLWLTASDRNAVNRAVNAIDHTLAASPHTAGVFIFDTVYEFTSAPLVVEFEVVDSTRKVFVLNVWDVALGRPTATGN